MKNKLFLVMLLLMILEIPFSCGIYTLEGTLNAPYNISRSTEILRFYGDNNESYFAGYNIWYKESEIESYQLAYYIKNGVSSIKPTIKKSDAIYDGSGPNEVSLKDLYPQYSNDNFYTINQNDSNKKFYFAVSAYGENGEESEKVEFPRWPN